MDYLSARKWLAKRPIMQIPPTDVVKYIPSRLFLSTQRTVDASVHPERFFVIRPVSTHLTPPVDAQKSDV